MGIDFSQIKIGIRNQSIITWTVNTNMGFFFMISFMTGNGMRRENAIILTNSNSAANTFVIYYALETEKYYK